MSANDINNLINIRNFIFNSLNNPIINRDKINRLVKVGNYLDLTIIDAVLADSFKQDIEMTLANSAALKAATITEAAEPVKVENVKVAVRRSK